MNEEKVNCWRVTLRTLGMAEKHTPFAVLVLSKQINERHLVADLRSQKFTPQWWDEHIITDIHYLGELWANLCTPSAF